MLALRANLFYLQKLTSPVVTIRIAALSVIRNNTEPNHAEPDFSPDVILRGISPVKTLSKQTPPNRRLLNGKGTRMFRRKTGWILAIVCTLTAGIGVAYWHHHKKFKHLATHESGMMYRSAWLEPDALQEVIEEHQIRTVVNLCNPGEMGEERWVRERDAVKNAGAKLVELPMPTSVDVNDPLIATHLELLSNPDNYPMLVHCQHGVTRTAKFLAIYDIVFRGETAEQSLAAQPLFGRKDHNVHVRAFVKNFEKQHKKVYPTANAERLSILRQ